MPVNAAMFSTSLNQDYKRYYPAEYAKNQYRLYIDSPLKTDREAEGKDID